MAARLFDDTTDTANVFNSKSVEGRNMVLYTPSMCVHMYAYMCSHMQYILPEQDQVHRLFGDVIKFIQVILHYKT